MQASHELGQAARLGIRVRKLTVLLNMGIDLLGEGAHLHRVLLLGGRGLNALAATARADRKVAAKALEGLVAERQATGVLLLVDDLAQGIGISGVDAHHLAKEAQRLL